MTEYIEVKNLETGQIYRAPASMLSDGSLMLPNYPIRRLATLDLVNLNSSTNVLLYTVPREKICIITHIVQRKASISLTTNSWSAGWTGTAYADVIATATHTELTGPTLASVIAAMVGQKVGVPGAMLYLKNNVLQGATATASFDVFGFLI